MPKRLIDDSLLTSPSLAALSPRGQDAFPRFILLADDFGCFDANARVLLGRGWPLRQDVTERDVATWMGEMEACGMLELWEEGGRSYGYLTGWYGPHGQRRRDEYDARTNPKGSKRRMPAPPSISRRGAAAGNPVSRCEPAREIQFPAYAVAVAVAVADASNPPNPPASRGAPAAGRLRPREARKLEMHAAKVAEGQHEARKRAVPPGRREAFLAAVYAFTQDHPDASRREAEAAVLPGFTVEATGPPVATLEAPRERAC